jgi:predicted nucleotidyltransferase
LCVFLVGAAAQLIVIPVTKKDKMLLDFIKPVITKLAELEEIVGIICFGSYAIDTADDKSDIDLLVLCRPDIPDSIKRLSTIGEISNSENIIQENQNDDIWSNEWSKMQDKIRVNGKIVEINYNKIDWIKGVVDKIKRRSATTLKEMPFRPYTLLGLLENSKVLYDPENEMKRLRDSLYPYPHHLKERLVQKSLSICKDSLIDLSDYAERKIGNTAFHFHFQRYLDSLYTLLFAINKKYDPATKRFEEYIKYFHVQPERFRERYDSVLIGPFDKNNIKSIVAELRAFINEIESKSQV